MCNICTRVYFALECKFAPRVYFMPCERCFKKIYPGAKIQSVANLPLLSRRSKLKLHPGVFVHPGVFCAYGRKTIFAMYFYGSLITGLINKLIPKINNKVSVPSLEKIYERSGYVGTLPSIYGTCTQN